MRFYHHSRDSRYRIPLGAQLCGTTVTISGTVYECSADFSAVVRFFTPNGQSDIPMQRICNTVSASVVLPQYPCLCHYDFLLNDGNRPCYYGGNSGEGRLLGQEGERFGLTVYNKDFSTPDWFKEGIAYQIFPDRFYCSDMGKREERLKEHTKLNRHVYLHNDWTEEPLHLKHDGNSSYAPDDYFGGDLEGIRQKLPYLCDLGVSCIYLNPIFEANSNHRYNTSDYKRIDPLLGDETDFIALCKDADKLGIKLILDGVFSHTGDDSRYFDRYGRYDTLGAFESKDSPYYPWYRFKDYPNSYECWWNFETLPNVEEMEPTYGDFIHGDDGVLHYWHKRGASGWRLDVADELPDEFIRQLRRRIKAENPDALILGEVWEDCSQKMGEQGRRAYVDGDLLDGSMNYPFGKATLAFVNGEMDAYAYNEAVQTLTENYPKPFLQACLNLLSSHDEVRAISYLSGGNKYTALPREAQALFHPQPELIEKGKEKYMQAMALVFSAVGVPCIYYGDEVGLEGMKDPFNRRTYPWGREDMELLDSIKTLTKLRNTSDALKKGRCRMGALTSSIFALIRYAHKEVVVTLINTADEPCSAILYPALLIEGEDGQTAVPFAGEYHSIDGKTMIINSVMQAQIAAHGYSIWRKHE